MLYNARSNKEINPAVMPKGWTDCGNKYKMFNIYPSTKERSCFMAKFAMLKGKISLKETVCFLLSNYIAKEKGLPYDAVALSVLQYGKHRKIGSGKSYSDYSVGSIPEAFHRVVRMSLKQLPIKKANALLYYVVSAFYNAPDGVIERMCRRVEELKNGKMKTAEKYIVLQSYIPGKEYRCIQRYAVENGMTLNELMMMVLRSVCMSKRERQDDYSPIARLFNLYRIMAQDGNCFKGGELVKLYVFVGDAHDKKYLDKFLRRRNLTRGEILRKAVRAFLYVTAHKEIFVKRVEYRNEEMEEVDSMEYVYNQLVKLDFYRSIYR